MADGKLRDEYVKIKGEVADLLSETGNFLADLTAEPSEVLGQHLNQSFQTFSSAKKKAEHETIDCALMALTKSGEHTIPVSCTSPESAALHCSVGTRGSRGRDACV